MSAKSLIKAGRAVALGILVLLALALCVGCSAAVDTSGDTTLDPEQVDGGAGVASASVSTLVDRACVAGEEGLVTPFGLSLTESGCTERLNTSGIPGGRSWCCPSGTIPADTTDT